MTFAVGVDESGSGAMDDEARAAKVRDVPRAIDRAGKKPRDQRHRVRPGNRRDGDEIEPAVIDLRAGSDAGAVAVLVAVGDGEREDRKLRVHAVVLDGAEGTAISAEQRGGGREIAPEAAPREPVETIGNLRLEAQAGDGEEGVAVGEAAVDETGCAGAQNAQRLVNGTVNAEMAAEPVAGTAGHEPEGGGGADEGSGHFVQGAVAADGDDQRTTVGEGGGGEFGGVARAFGEDDFRAQLRGGGLDACQNAGDVPGARVDDKTGFHRGHPNGFGGAGRAEAVERGVRGW